MEYRRKSHYFFTSISLLAISLFVIILAIHQLIYNHNIFAVLISLIFIYLSYHTLKSIKSISMENREIKLNHLFFGSKLLTNIGEIVVEKKDYRKGRVRYNRITIKTKKEVVHIEGEFENYEEMLTDLELNSGVKIKGKLKAM